MSLVGFDNHRPFTATTANIYKRWLVEVTADGKNYTGKPVMVDDRWTKFGDAVVENEKIKTLRFIERD